MPKLVSVKPKVVFAAKTSFRAAKKSFLKHFGYLHDQYTPEYLPKLQSLKNHYIPLYIQFMYDRMYERMYDHKRGLNLKI